MTSKCNSFVLVVEGGKNIIIMSRGHYALHYITLFKFGSSRLAYAMGARNTFTAGNCTVLDALSDQKVCVLLLE